MKTVAHALVGMMLCAGLLLGLAGCDGSTDDETRVLLRVAHAASGIAPLDFLVDFNLLAQDLAFRNASPYTRWDAGLRLLEVRTLQNNAPVSVSREVLLDEDAAYTVLVAGTADASSLVLLEDNRSDPPSGLARVRVAHAATNVGAATVQVTPSGGGNAVLSAANLRFGAATDDALVAAGTFDILVDATDGGGILRDQALEAGRRYLVVLTNAGGAPLFVVVDG